MGCSVEKSPRILIIGEDPVLGRSLQKALSQRGGSAELLETGEDVLEKIGFESYDLVLSDLNLPGMRGWEILTQIRRSFPELPLIVITNQVDSWLVKELSSMGVLQVLEKTHSIEEIRKIIAEKVERL